MKDELNTCHRDATSLPVPYFKFITLQDDFIIEQSEKSDSRPYTSNNNKYRR